MDLLQQARETINGIDAQMAALFEQRMRAVQAVAEYKKEHGLPILDAAREEAVLRRGASRVEDSVLQEYYIDFMKSTMAVSRRYQQRLLTGMRVAYSGTEGAFAHIAAGRLFPEAQKIGFPDFAAAYDAVVQGDCDAVVLPLENSSAGEVGQVTDLLFSGPLYVSTVLPMPIKHDLLALEGTTPETVRTVVSHPQALAQCDEYIRAHGYEQLPYANTALAAKYVAELGDPAVAAIGSVECAAACGLKPVAEAINGSQQNTTRFAVLTRAENRSTDKMHGVHFMLVFTVRNEAGALARALDVIGAHGFNMRTLRSRPMRELLWQYYFYVEAEGNIHSADGEAMLQELTAYCDKIKCVGSFI